MDKLLEATYRVGVESREQPLYTITEAGAYLGIDPQTLTTWMFGRNYRTKSGQKFWPPTAILPEQTHDPQEGLFANHN